MTAYKTVILQKEEEGIASLILNRPEKLNAVTKEMFHEILAAVREVRKSPDIRVLILKGRGRAFCVGGDMSGSGEDVYTKEYGPKEEMLWERQAHLDYWLRGTFELFWELPQITIAQVHGYAIVVGLELAMLCDLVIATETAKFRLDPTFAIGGKFTNLWPLLLGIRKCKEKFLTNAWVLGKEAEELGMINKAVPDDRLEPEVMTMAREIARLPLDFIACNKLGVNRFFEEMGVKKAVEESLTIHAFGSMFKQREELIRAALDKGWRAGHEYRDKKILLK